MACISLRAATSSVYGFDFGQLGAGRSSVSDGFGTTDDRASTSTHANHGREILENFEKGSLKEESQPKLEPVQTIYLRTQVAYLTRTTSKFRARNSNDDGKSKTVSKRT